MDSQKPYQDEFWIDHVASAIARAHGFNDVSEASALRRLIFRKKAKAALMNEQDKIEAE